MTVYIIPNTSKPSAMEITCRAAKLLAEDDVALVFDEDCPELPISVSAGKILRLPAQKACEVCDIVLTVGGDGTLLHAARLTMRFGKPILGINTGRLGFLTTIESDELEKLRRLAKGEYQVENRAMIKAVTGAPGAEPCMALNDVLLFKESPEKTISLDIFCDDIPVSRFRGDGVVFATPTGSTAYSMSAGGPIVDARLGGIIVTQICAHIVQTPPMVFAAGRVLRVVPTVTHEEERVLVSCDGMKAVPLADGDEVWICQAEQGVQMIQFHDANQLKSIDKKLKGR